MKTILPCAVIAVILISQMTNAQTGESVNKIRVADYIFTTHAIPEAQQPPLMDNMQQETEQLILTISPSAVFSRAKLNEKLQALQADGNKEGMDLLKASPLE
jgi:Skp family chaperone for outer membrane proteins